MLTEKDIEMIQRFLQKNYPVQRVKTNLKFKRAILFDNGHTYWLSNDRDKTNLKREMVNLSMRVFGFDEKLTTNIVTNYLKV